MLPFRFLSQSSFDGRSMLLHTIHFFNLFFCLLSYFQSHIFNGAIWLYSFASSTRERERKLTGCSALYCRACHNERRFSGVGRWRTEGVVKEKTGAKYYAETAGHLSRKVHRSSLRQMETGKRQNGRESYRQAMPGWSRSKAISYVAESPGKTPSVRDFTSPECCKEVCQASPAVRSLGAITMMRTAPLN